MVIVVPLAKATPSILLLKTSLSLDVGLNPSDLSIDAARGCQVSTTLLAVSAHAAASGESEASTSTVIAGPVGGPSADAPALGASAGTWARTSAGGPAIASVPRVNRDHRIGVMSPS